MCRILVTNCENNIVRADPTLINGGPDEQVELRRMGKVFKHYRLIIQGSNTIGIQPKESERYVMLFNGEVYNQRELLDRYSLNQKFLSDTDLLFELFIRFGQEVFGHIEGMFAVVIYDKQRDEYIIARDVFGKKPLYWYKEGSEFWICSQYEWFGCDNENVALKRIFGFYPEPFTGNSRVNIFRAGFSTRFSEAEGVLSEVEFDSNANPSWNFDEALVSDVPVVLAYSGGIDSSNLFKIYGKAVKCMSINKSLPNSHEISLNKYDIQRYRQEWINCNGNLLSIDGLNAYILSKEVKKSGAKVVLTGTGGDELFSGYKQHRYFLVIWLFSFLPSVLIKYATVLKGRLSRLDWLLVKHLPRKMRVYLAVRGVCNASEIKQSPKELKMINQIYHGRSVYFKRLGRERVFANLEMSIFLKSRLLRDADYFSMVNGIEMRMPFLNRSILKYINGNILLNSILLPNKLGSILLYRNYSLIKKVFQIKEGFFIGENVEKKSLL